MRPTSTSYFRVAVRGIGYSKFAGSSTTCTPGASFSSERAISGVTSFSVSMVIASAWARNVGILTDVQLQAMSAPKIFCVSQTTFISSLV